MTNQKGPIPAQSQVATLGDVLAAVGTQQDLSETRRRDLRSAVNRVAALLGDAPERIPEQRSASAQPNPSRGSHYRNFLERHFG